MLGPSYLQWDDVLCGIFLLINDDVPVHEDIIEQEELTGFGLLPAGLGEDALPHQDPTCQRTRSQLTFQRDSPALPWDCQRLAGRPEALLHIRDPPGVGRGVDCNTIEIQLAHVDKVIAVSSDIGSDNTQVAGLAWTTLVSLTSEEGEIRHQTK